jgi:hypothetical protein
MTAEFNSPRDAERWDRMQESLFQDSSDRKAKDARPLAAPLDPRANAEEWYRDHGRTSGQSRH